MWKPAQIKKVEEYARLAHLSDFELQVQMYQVTGYRTPAARGIKQRHFDMIMPILEDILADRLDSGEVDMASIPRYMKIGYWRQRVPGPGMMTSRQDERIRQLWEQLQPTLPAGDQDLHYLLRIATKASKRSITNLAELRQWQAAQLIDALQDRLQHA